MGEHRVWYEETDPDELERLEPPFARQRRAAGAALEFAVRDLKLDPVPALIWYGYVHGAAARELELCGRWLDALRGGRRPAVWRGDPCTIGSTVLCQALEGDRPRPWIRVRVDQSSIDAIRTTLHECLHLYQRDHVPLPETPEEFAALDKDAEAYAHGNGLPYLTYGQLAASLLVGIGGPAFLLTEAGRRCLENPKRIMTTDGESSAHEEHR